MFKINLREGACIWKGRSMYILENRNNVSVIILNHKGSEWDLPKYYLLDFTSYLVLKSSSSSFMCIALEYTPTCKSKLKKRLWSNVEEICSLEV